MSISSTSNGYVPIFPSLSALRPDGAGMGRPVPVGLGREKNAGVDGALATNPPEPSVQIGQIDGIVYLSPAEQAVQQEKAMAVKAHSVFRVNGVLVATIGMDGVTIIPGNDVGAKIGQDIFEKGWPSNLSHEEGVEWLSRALEKRLQELYPAGLTASRSENTAYMPTMGELRAEIEKSFTLAPLPIPFLEKVDISV